jgi:cobalamin biosynthesis protein CbiG
MKKLEIFKQKQAAMTDKELCELVDKELSKLCKTYGKSFTMSIPPRITDTDMLIGQMLKRFKELSNCV